MLEGLKQWHSWPTSLPGRGIPGGTFHNRHEPTTNVLSLPVNAAAAHPAGVNACCCGGDIACPLPSHARHEEPSPGEEIGDAAGDDDTGTPEPTAGKTLLLPAAGRTSVGCPGLKKRRVFHRSRGEVTDNLEKPASGKTAPMSLA